MTSLQRIITMQSDTPKMFFRDFCIWLKDQSEEEKIVSDVRLKQYEENLLASGIDKSEIETRMMIIAEALFKIDMERWDRVYRENERNEKNSPPNRFMTGIVEDLSVGKALDVGMGEGRNLLYLAHKGWQTTGLEASGEGFLSAQKQAALQGLDVNLFLTNYEKYDFGKNAWDLILLLYVPLKNIAEKVIESLNENGKIIVEAYHTDSGDHGIFGDKVIFASNELLTIFKRLNIYFYEEIKDHSDFGDGKVPVVRLYAGKSAKR